MYLILVPGQVVRFICLSNKNWKRDKSESEAWKIGAEISAVPSVFVFRRVIPFLFLAAIGESNFAPTRLPLRPKIYSCFFYLSPRLHHPVWQALVLGRGFCHVSPQTSFLGLGNWRVILPLWFQDMNWGPEFLDTHSEFIQNLGITCRNPGHKAQHWFTNLLIISSHYVRWI